MIAEAFTNSLLYESSHGTLVVVMRGLGPAERALHREICAMMADVRAREQQRAAQERAAA